MATEAKKGKWAKDWKVSAPKTFGRAGFEIHSTVSEPITRSWWPLSLN
jgi:hypothetical protein